ncbi:MAG: hypothetical protein CBB68_10245 [Rhodospirillaceae bacterium TMED8]|nr:hypothetical protein [Magnetovibrio sp.]OUT50232.1 MAG: hypothetical protein CBB68_10245 [Rhodospirillaceae bacterium TMED8]
MSFQARFVLLTTGILAISSCDKTAPMISTSPGDNGESATSTRIAAYRQFPDIPVPTGATINMEKTLVLGTNPWFGQLAISTATSTNGMFDFYRENLRAYGWQEITAVRAPTSILTYATPDRVLAIAIQSGTLVGSDITITVSPRGQIKTTTGSALPSSGVPNDVQGINQ